MGFSLAALFGFGRKKAEPERAPADARASAARDAAPAPAAHRTAEVSVAPAIGRPAPVGVSALMRAHASAAAGDDLMGAYQAAKVLAEAFRAQGRMQLSMKWAVEAGELAVAAAAAGAPRRPMVARKAAAAAALRFVESGRALAAGPHAGVLRRVCGKDAAALMAGHGAWLAELGFSTGPADADEEDAAVRELAA